MRNRIFFFLALLACFCASLEAQNSAPPISTVQLNLPLNASETPVTQANLALVGNPGPSAACYWIVTHFTLGASSPAFAGCLNNLPNSLSVSNYVQIIPAYTSGISSVDLLKTPTAAIPFGACNCAVATAVSSGAINDQSNSTSSYSVPSAINPTLFTYSIDNEVVSAGVTHPILRQNGVFVVDLAVGGSAANPGGTPGQSQYNVGGISFGGYTMNGDATLNTSTGAITVSHAATADATTGTPTNCGAGLAPTGVDSNWNALNCSPLGGISGPGVTIAGNIAGWNNNTGTALFDTGFAFPLPINTSVFQSITTTINGVTCNLAGSCTITAVPSGSAGTDITGTYPSGLIVSGVNHVPLCNGFTFTTTNNSLQYTTSSSPNPCITASPGNGLINVMTTLGDMLSATTGGAPARVAGATSPNGIAQYLTSTPASGLATTPAWALPGVVGRSVTGTTDTIATTDCSPKEVAYTGSSAVAVTLPTPTTLAVPSCRFKVANYTTATVTITPTTWTISAGSGATPGATLALLEGQEAVIGVDPVNATNWVADVVEQGITAGSNITITRGVSGITIAATGGGSSTVNNALQFSLPYYSAAGTTNTISGVNGPTTGNSPYFWITIPSGGVATAPQSTLLGTATDTQSGTTFTIQSDTQTTPDRNKLVITTNSTSSTNVTVPQPGTSGMGTYFAFTHCNTGTVAATDTPTSSTVNGNSTLTLVGAVSAHNPECALWWNNLTNWFAAEILPTDANGKLASEGFPNGFPVVVATGGTGLTSTTAYAPLFGGTTSTGNLQSGTAGTSKQILASGGASAIGSYKSLADLESTLGAAGGGSANAQLVSLAPPATSYAAYGTIRWLPTAANTSATTINVNSLGVVNLTKCGTTALVANDLLTTVIATATYDGTEFQLQNPQAVGCAGGTVATGTTDGVAYYTSASAIGSTTPPTVNGLYFTVENVTASASVAPTHMLPGVPVDSTNPATLLYSDRANFLNWTSGTALALPAVTSNFASNLPFSLLNTSGGTLTVTPNAAASDTCNSASTCTVANDIFGMFYSTGSAPGSWYKIGLVTDLIGVTSSSTLTNHGVLLGAGSLAIGSTAAGTAGQPLLSGGSSADPSYGTLGATYGGTGIDSHTSTGVAQVSSGTWTIATSLPSGVTATTQTPCDNSTKVATTAYVGTVCNTVETSGSPLSATAQSQTLWNNTASTYTVDLPTPTASGPQICLGNYQARTGALSLVPGTGVTIYFKGVAGTAGSATGLVSGGAAGDFICLEGTDSTTYMAIGSGYGTWTNH